MVNKREEERREDGNKGRGKRGKRRSRAATNATHGAAEGGSWGRKREKRGATEEEKNGAVKNGSELRYD